AAANAESASAAMPSLEGVRRSAWSLDTMAMRQRMTEIEKRYSISPVSQNSDSRGSVAVQSQIASNAVARSRAWRLEAWNSARTAAYTSVTANSQMTATKVGYAHLIRMKQVRAYSIVTDKNLPDQPK